MNNEWKSLGEYKALILQVNNLTASHLSLRGTEAWTLFNAESDIQALCQILWGWVFFVQSTCWALFLLMCSVHLGTVLTLFESIFERRWIVSREDTGLVIGLFTTSWRHCQITSQGPICQSWGRCPYWCIARSQHLHTWFKMMNHCSKEAAILMVRLSQLRLCRSPCIYSLLAIELSRIPLLFLVHAPVKWKHLDWQRVHLNV